jgi:hypothetical protein
VKCVTALSRSFSIRTSETTIVRHIALLAMLCYVLMLLPVIVIRRLSKASRGARTGRRTQKGTAPTGGSDTILVPINQTQIRTKASVLTMHACMHVSCFCSALAKYPYSDIYPWMDSDCRGALGSTPLPPPPCKLHVWLINSSTNDRILTVQRLSFLFFIFNIFLEELHLERVCVNHLYVWGFGHPHVSREDK